jgi:hypothetical protein
MGGTGACRCGFDPQRRMGSQKQSRQTEDDDQAWDDEERPAHDRADGASQTPSAEIASLG